jgi:hypothetical protein
MSVLTVAAVTALFTTPIVHVSHDLIVEQTRPAPIQVSAQLPQGAHLGIDETEISKYVTRATLRYQGF